jgi:ring-1,2-phenylacetyl-CoA epoxidase subunit PaaD
MVTQGLGYGVWGMDEPGSAVIDVPENPKPHTPPPKPNQEDLMRVLATVMDPEIPTLSVIDLGMITEATASNGYAHVRLLPTFVACPATSYIRKSIEDALMSAGFKFVEVEMEDKISWTSDRVTQRGKKLLEEFGLGAPVQIDGVLSLDTIEHVDCPHCGSANTTLRSMFGSTLCRSIHYCNDCKQGFERFKPV